MKKKKILKILRRKSLTKTEISFMINANNNITSKFLDELENEGEIEKFIDGSKVKYKLKIK